MRTLSTTRTVVAAALSLLAACGAGDEEEERLVSLVEGFRPPAHPDAVELEWRGRAARIAPLEGSDALRFVTRIDPAEWRPTQWSGVWSVPAPARAIGRPRGEEVEVLRGGGVEWTQLPLSPELLDPQSLPEGSFVLAASSLFVLSGAAPTEPLVLAARRPRARARARQSTCAASCAPSILTSVRTARREYGKTARSSPRRRACPTCPRARGGRPAPRRAARDARGDGAADGVSSALGRAGQSVKLRDLATTLAAVALPSAHGRAGGARRVSRAA